VLGPSSSIVFFKSQGEEENAPRGLIRKVESLILNLNYCLRFLQQPITMLPSSQECEACVLLCTFVIALAIVV
jgi:hypothetical protein